MATLTSLQIISDTDRTELYLPSFELKVVTRVPELEGIRVSESRRIKEAKLECSIEVIHAQPQDEGLLPDKPEPEKAEIMDTDFVFVLTDGDLEEKVESMPLFVSMVTPMNFISA